MSTLNLKNISWSLVLILGLTLGFVSPKSYASLPSATSTEENHTIQDYVKFLNHCYPQLNLKAKGRSLATYRQLELLDQALEAAEKGLPWRLGDGDLIELACNLPACGNGGGNCTTC